LGFFHKNGEFLGCLQTFREPGKGPLVLHGIPRGFLKKGPLSPLWETQPPGFTSLGPLVRSWGKRFWAQVLGTPKKCFPQRVVCPTGPIGVSGAKPGRLFHTWGFKALGFPPFKEKGGVKRHLGSRGEKILGKFPSRDNFLFSWENLSHLFWGCHSPRDPGEGPLKIVATFWALVSLPPTN